MSVLSAKIALFEEKPVEKQKFTFIDLFAGIGGFHQAMHKLGGECRGFSEIDPYCIETYKNNFASAEFFFFINNYVLLEQDKLQELML